MVVLGIVLDKFDAKGKIERSTQCSIPEPRSSREYRGKLKNIGVT